MTDYYDKAIDKGLEGVITCKTRISSIIDATLTYRGYKIEDLVKRYCFEEIIYLLWFNKIPSQAEQEQLKQKIASNLKLDPNLVKLLKQFPHKNVHPMAWLRSAVSLLALTDQNADNKDEVSLWNKAYALVTKTGLLVAAFERIRNGQDIITPRPNQSLAWNFLYCLKGQEPDEDIVRIFDVCLILHADHELNCSSFAARVTTSSLSDVYSAVVSAIGTLKGPLHGGANEQVMRMLKSIGTIEKAKEWIAEALAHKKKIMGFGHRVYKNGDPRAKILKQMSKSLSEKISMKDKNEPSWFKISETIEDIVRERKGLLPNVDFYSASVYYSMGIPLDLYTPIFAFSRMSGWLAHILEQYANNRIYRPRALYVGEVHRTH